jgi:hypothetical protein
MLNHYFFGFLCLSGKSAIMSWLFLLCSLADALMLSALLALLSLI